VEECQGCARAGRVGCIDKSDRDFMHSQDGSNLSAPRDALLVMRLFLPSVRGQLSVGEAELLEALASENTFDILPCQRSFGLGSLASNRSAMSIPCHSISFSSHCPFPSPQSIQIPTTSRRPSFPFVRLSVRRSPSCVPGSSLIILRRLTLTERRHPDRTRT
jgi:hypothetical protein